jgi:hypothetical protein
VAFCGLRHGPPPLRGRRMCPLLAVGVSGSQRSFTVSAQVDVLAQQMVNGARGDVSGAQSTASGTRVGRDHTLESGDSGLGCPTGFVRDA